MPASPVRLATVGSHPPYGQSDRPSARVAHRPSQLSRDNWSGDRKQTTLWQIASRGQDTETVHGTQKPVECMRRPIENNSSPGQAVYEPFSGSGTRVIAAKMSGRACHAIELSPAYVDVAIKRWQ